MNYKGYRINPDIGKEDEKQVKAIQKGVRFQVNRIKEKGAPVARFDHKIKKPYLEYSDGRREYGNA